MSFYGIVDLVRKRYEGAEFDTDAFRAADGALPVDVSYAAHVQVTRIEPEVFVPAAPGRRGARRPRRGRSRRRCTSTAWSARSPIGLTRTGEPVYANLEFLDGTRGAHASISGVSGVATKTSYATFLLYSLFHSGALGRDAANTKAIIFNVKGEDLLWLDRPNAALDDEGRAPTTRRLGLPAGPFQSVGLFAPAGARRRRPMPDTGGRQEGVRPYLWTLREFAANGCCRFAFAEADDARAQLWLRRSRGSSARWSAPRVRATHERPASPRGRQRRCADFDDLVELLEHRRSTGWPARRRRGHARRVPPPPARGGASAWATWCAATSRPRGTASTGTRTRSRSSTSTSCTPPRRCSSSACC